jgi:hypothetical protein
MDTGASKSCHTYPFRYRLSSNGRETLGKDTYIHTFSTDGASLLSQNLLKSAHC